MTIIIYKLQLFYLKQKLVYLKLNQRACLIIRFHLMKFAISIMKQVEKKYPGSVDSILTEILLKHKNHGK